DPVKTSESYGSLMNSQLNVNQLIPYDYLQQFYHPSTVSQYSWMSVNNSPLTNFSSIPLFQTPNENKTDSAHIFSQYDNDPARIRRNNNLSLVSTNQISINSTTSPIPSLMSIQVSRAFNNQKTVSTFQSSIAQNMTQLNSYGSSVSTENRQRTPLTIVDPISHKQIEISTQSTNTLFTNKSNETCLMKLTTPKSVISNKKSLINKNKKQIQLDSQPKMTNELANSSKTKTDKKENVTTKTKRQRRRRKQKPSQKCQYDESIPEVNEKINSHWLKLQSTTPSTATVLLECVTPSIINKDKSQSQRIQVLPYDSNELIDIHDNSAPLTMLTNLRNLETDINQDDQSKIDDNSITLNDVESILDKITSQTYDELKTKLETLNIDCYEKLEKMTMLFYSKVNGRAVDEPASSFLYANLCKQFQKTAIKRNDNGKMRKHCFGGILTKHCKNEFKNVQSQEIEFEKQNPASDSVKVEKNHTEEPKTPEKIIIDKQRYLRNIM
ncbi:unnamed protein product, partial [Rotaria sp. Silwood2]